MSSNKWQMAFLYISKESLRHILRKTKRNSILLTITKEFASEQKKGWKQNNSYCSVIFNWKNKTKKKLNLLYVIWVDISWTPITQKIKSELGFLLKVGWKVFCYYPECKVVGWKNKEEKTLTMTTTWNPFSSRNLLLLLSLLSLLFYIDGLLLNFMLGSTITLARWRLTTRENITNKNSRLRQKGYFCGSQRRIIPSKIGNGWQWRQ